MSDLKPKFPSKIQQIFCILNIVHLLFLFSKNLTYEIILTLGQAFEVAYQLALQAQKSKSPAILTAEMIETKSSKPVPKPRVSMRKSTVCILHIFILCYRTM